MAYGDGAAPSARLARVMPRFRKGEVVRVEHLEDGRKPEEDWVVGEEGVVYSIASPNERGTSWVYLVGIGTEPTDRTLWRFDESNLTSLGVLEAEDCTRTPLTDAPAARELRDEIGLLLATEIEDEEVARRVADDAVAALRSLLSVRALHVETARP